MLKIGADPEFFLKTEAGFTAGHDLIPGTKKDPFTVDKGAVQVDGCALEFNINPAVSEDEFFVNIQTVMKTLRDMVPDWYDFSTASVAQFPKGYIQTLPEEVQALGCEADYDAYTGMKNLPPDPNERQRTAAGHVHIGWGDNLSDHFDDCCVVAKALDAYLGVPSVILDPEGKARREMYGKAGAFRPKPYGMEYRVLSNFWLFSEDRIKWVFKNSLAAMAALRDGWVPDDEPQEIINDSMVTMAHLYCEEVGVAV